MLSLGALSLFLCLGLSLPRSLSSSRSRVLSLSLCVSLSAGFRGPGLGSPWELLQPRYAELRRASVRYMSATVGVPTMRSWVLVKRFV